MAVLNKRITSTLWIIAFLTLAFIAGGSAWYYGFDPRLVGPITASMLAVMISLWSTQRSEEMTRKSIKASHEAIQETLKNSLKEKVYEYEYKEYKELYSQVAEVSRETDTMLVAFEEYIKKASVLKEEDFHEKKGLLLHKLVSTSTFFTKSLHISDEIKEPLDKILLISYEVAMSNPDFISEVQMKEWTTSIKSSEQEFIKIVKRNLYIEVLSKENQSFFKTLHLNQMFKEMHNLR